MKRFIRKSQRSKEETTLSTGSHFFNVNFKKSKIKSLQFNRDARH